MKTLRRGAKTKADKRRQRILGWWKVDRGVVRDSARVEEAPPPWATAMGPRGCSHLGRHTWEAPDAAETSRTGDQLP